MQATIHYLLSDEAQRAHMKATGQSVGIKQTMTVEIKPQDLDLFAVSQDGEISLNLTQGYDTNSARALQAAGVLDSHRRAVSYAPDFVAALREGYADLAQADAQKEAERKSNGEHNRQVVEEAYQSFLADKQARIHGFAGTFHTGALSQYLGEDRLKTPADYWPSDHKEFRAEAERRNVQDAQEAEAAKAAKEQAKLDYLDRWMEQSAAPDMRAQYADKLLSREDALTAIAGQAFAQYKLEEWTPALCGDNRCSCGRNHVQTLPQHVYPQFRALKARLPENAVLETERVRECSRDNDYPEPEEPLPPVYAVNVKLPVGPFLFERLVRL